MNRKAPKRGGLIDYLDMSAKVGAVLAEQHDEWAEGRRYLGLDVLTKSQTVGATDAADEEMTDPALQAISARPHHQRPSTTRSDDHLNTSI